MVVVRGGGGGGGGGSGGGGGGGEIECGLSDRRFRLCVTCVRAREEGVCIGRGGRCEWHLRPIRL